MTKLKWKNKYIKLINIIFIINIAKYSLSKTNQKTFLTKNHLELTIIFFSPKFLLF
jgi:hypothetical protein